MYEILLLLVIVLLFIFYKIELVKSNKKNSTHELKYYFDEYDNYLDMYESCDTGYIVDCETEYDSVPDDNWYKVVADFEKSRKIQKYNELTNKKSNINFTLDIPSDYYTQEGFNNKSSSKSIAEHDEKTHKDLLKKCNGNKCGYVGQERNPY
jgi:hypothetical protein